MDDPRPSSSDSKPSLDPTGSTGPAGPQKLRCPHCHNPLTLQDAPGDEVLCPCCGSSFRVRDARLTDTVNTSRPLGKFQLLERVGQGSFGAVWKARDTVLDRVVALKIPHSGLFTEAEELERFHREARAAAQLRHPGIVTVHEVLTLEGLPAIVADFVQGATLKDFLEVRKLTFQEAATLIADVAEALDYAHRMGLVHRDVKPGNIMLDYGPPERTPGRRELGKPLLMDFGLALRSEAEVTLTLDGHVIGTPAYMSPEQAAGKGHQADRRSDVYSLGVILYELFTGELPFRGSKAMLLLQVLQDEPRPPRRLNEKIPRDLETICLKALAKVPKQRYATARELADDLRHFLLGEPIKARPVGRLERLGRWCRRNPVLAGWIGAAAAMLLLVAGVATVGYVQTSRALQGQTQAQLAALLNAAPQAVPDILKGLEPLRARVLPQLQAIRAQPEPQGQTEVALRLWKQHRLRASLALLPEDPQQLAFLGERLLAEEVEPEEMLLIRDQLVPHREALVEGLWVEVERAEVPANQRFRALVALARLDPDNPRWPAAAPAVVEQLVKADPVHAGIWARGLRDVRLSLLEPLGKVFHDRERPAERRLAASVLQDYAADRLEVLADCVMDADPQQFAIFLPALRRQGEKAVAVLHRELERQPTAAWPDAPLDPRWSAPARALVEEIEQAQGLVANRYALCQTLPLELFAAVAEGLRPAGYRPIRCRPFAHHDTVQVAAVWTRDGRDWQLALGLTADQVRQEDTRRREAGMIPVEVAGYLEGPQPRHVAVWGMPTEKDETARLYVGVLAAQHQAAQDALKAEDHVPATLQALPGLDGQEWYSGVWHKGETVAQEWTVSWDITEQDYLDKREELSRVPVDVQILRAPPLQNPGAQAAEQLARAEKEVQEKPTDLNALYRRSQAYARLGQEEKALADLNVLVTKASSFAGGYQQRALVHARLGHAAEARADLAEFDKRSTSANTRIYLHAVVSAYLGEDRAGLKALEEAIQARPQDADFLYDAACAYAVAARAMDHPRPSRTGGLASWAILGTGPGRAVLLPAVVEHLRQLQQEQQERARSYTGRALALLRQAVSHGYADFSHMQTDADLDALDAQPEFQDLLKRGHLDRRYAAVWHGSGARAAAEAHGLDVAAHRSRCRELAAQGYRPAALSVAPGDGPTLLTASVWHRPMVTGAMRDALAQRQANAAAALLHRGQPARVWPLFRHTPYPDARSHLLHRVGPLEVDARPVVDRLLTEADVSARRALILSLGEFTAEQLPQSERQRVLPRLLAWYEQDGDPGIHGAIDWLLRPEWEGPVRRKIVWGQARALQQIDERLKGQAPPPGRRWSVNGQGQTLALLDASEEFLMGSPGHEPQRRTNELFHRRQIGRTVALATQEVTVAQFRRFLRAHPEVKHFYTKQYSPDDEGPQTAVTWYEAAQYCRWLSEQEGIPEEQMCYPAVAEIEKCKDGVTPLKLPADYLRRTGYRLPSEAEWEYACRAGAHARYAYGFSEDLLTHYTWYIGNARDRAWPAGQKKPNDLGLFDMHGNAWEWCQEAYGGSYKVGAGGRSAGDKEDLRDITDRISRVLRGGAFLSQARDARSAGRYIFRPTLRNYAFGFRVARTYP